MSTGLLPLPGKTKTRIQRENEEKLLAAALKVFSREGFRGATVDQIAFEAGMSKPNLLYYFRSKEDIYRAVLHATLQDWLEPLRAIRADGDPVTELRGYLHLKLEMSRRFPEASRLFASEMLRGGALLADEMAGPLRDLVVEKAAMIQGWIDAGKLAPHDPRHLIFAIWATTQHYADFDAQVCAVLGDDSTARFDAAGRFLDTMFFEGLRPRGTT